MQVDHDGQFNYFISNDKCITIVLELSMSPRKEPICGLVVPTIDMSSFALMKSPHPLIPRPQPIGGVVMNPNQDRLDNRGRGLPKALSHLIF